MSEQERDLQVDNRKDLLLLILAARGPQKEAEPVIGVTRLQKYLYLLQEEHRWHEKFGLRNPYVFEPYDFGPFDSQLYDDLELLENTHFITRDDGGPEPSIEDEEARWFALETGTVDRELAPWEEDDRVACYLLTNKGKEFVARYQLSDEDWETLNNLKQEWNGKPLQALLRWLYATHPEAAVNTKLRHLRADESTS